MQRELKFRAWNHIVGRMSDPVLLSEFPKDTQWQNLEIMQFTGLRDKNGTEIYEGDIVEAYSKNFPRIGITGVVCYGEGEYEIETINDPKWPVASIVVVEDIRVLGNIYQNPELLKES